MNRAVEVLPPEPPHEIQLNLMDRSMHALGFTDKQIAPLYRIGNWLNQNAPYIALGSTILGYATRVKGEIDLGHWEEYGPLPAILAPFDNPFPEHVKGEFAANAEVSVGQVLFEFSLVGESIRRVWEKIKFDKESAENQIRLLRQQKENKIINGEFPNPFKEVALMMDFTSTETSRSHEGQLVTEIYSLLEENPDVEKEFTEKFGEPLEMVRHSVPVPITLPKRIYERSPSEDFDIDDDETDGGQGWLSQTVQVQKATLAIVGLMDPDHTIHDPDSEAIKRLIERRTMVQNAVSIIESKSEYTDQLDQLMKIVVVNDEIRVPIHGAYTRDSSREPVTMTLREDFYYQDYKVVVAEEENMDRMIGQFIKEGLHNIVLFNDGTPDGYSISENWFEYYEANKEKYAKKHGLELSQLPTIKPVPSEKLSALITILNEEPHDAVFLIGAKDSDVASSARGIIEFQKDQPDHTRPAYPTKPIICLFEGRTAKTKIRDLKGKKINHPTKSGEDIDNIQDFYVHRNNAKAVLEKALGRKIDWADEKVQEEKKTQLKKIVK